MNQNDKKLMFCEDCGKEFKYESTYFIVEKRSQVKEYRCGCPKIKLETVKVFTKEELAPWEMSM